MFWRPATHWLAVVAICWMAATTVGRGQDVVVNPLPSESLATFYHLPEGGGVMPFAFYNRLEVIDAATGLPTGQTFAERMPGYGFLTDEDADLPVGFSTVPLDFLGGLRVLSLNCAACHVGELHVAGESSLTRLRIVGGPNMADFRQFSQDVYTSLLELVVSPGRLLNVLIRDRRLQPETLAWLEQLSLRPVGKYQVRADSPRADELLADVARMTILIRQNDGQWQDTFTTTGQRGNPASVAVQLDIFRNLQLLIAEANYFLAQGRYPLTTREGFGRLDAFGTVRYLLFPGASADAPFTAPAGVPHLWGIGQKKWLHWNNNTNSTLQRNIAQSLGTGAVQARSGINNVILPNLAELETLAQQIESPRWPVEILGPLDDDLVEQGRVLYEARCASCHEAGIVDPDSGLVEYPLFTLAEAGTDPNYALNFHAPVGTRPFAESLGTRMDSLANWYYTRSDPQHPVPVATQTAWSGGESRLPAVWRDPLATSVDGPVYAALPLVGVWATAPYLHNASVPTLRDLLKPSSQRPTVFQVGHRDYDPLNVGYTQTVAADQIPAQYRFDTSETGNSNAGHDGPAFGAEGLTADEIDALLEYLKSL